MTDIDHLIYSVYSYIAWIIIIPPIASLCYQFDGIFIGASQTSDMRNAMIVSVAIFLASSVYLIDIFHNNGLWLSILLFMIIRSLTLNIYFNNILRRF